MLFLGSLARRLSSVAGVLAAVSACTSSTSTVQVRTDGRLRVTPQEFTYDVGCSFASGEGTELGHYVATLLDLGAGDGGAKPEASGSGTAARCTSSTTFSTTGDESLVELEHRYAVIIDGYAGTTPPKVDGKRSDKWAAPNWQWLCGIGGLSETQLEELLTEAQSLAIGEQPIVPTPSAVLDAAVPTMDAAASDSAVPESTASDSAASDSAVSTVDTAATDAAATDAVTDATATDAAITAAPSTDESMADAAAPGDASVPTTADPATTSSAAVTSDAATTSNAMTSSGSDAASVTSGGDSTSAIASADDAGGSSTSAETAVTGETGADRWLTALLAAAADDDFAPPAKVVAGGQSGLRGCVPLF